MAEVKSMVRGNGPLVAGLALAGAAAWAWYVFGADFRRYLKIRSM